MKKILIIYMLFNSFLCFSQQDKISFKEYGVKEGLPEEVAINFIEDDQGFIWIATQNGLVKFNGYDMQLFGDTHEQGKNHSLLLSNIFSGFLKDKKGKLWIGGVSKNSGLSSYDPQTRHFSNILYHPDSTQLPFPDIRLHLVDKNNNIWFSSFSRDLDSTKLCRYDQGNDKFSQYPQRTNGFNINELISNGQIVSNATDGSIWILDQTTSSIKKYDAVTDSFQTKFKPGDTIDGKILPSEFFTIVMSDEFLVVTTKAAAILIDITSEKISKTVEFKTNSETESGCFLDKKNLLWCRAGKYLTIYNLNTDERKELIYGEGNLKQINSSGLKYPLLQTNEEIYFMQLNADQQYVWKYNYQTAAFTIYNDRFNDRANPKALKNFPLNMKIDFSGTRWLGTRPNLYKEDEKKIKSITHFGKEQIKIDSLNMPFEDSKNRLWISFSGGVMLKEVADKEFQIYLFEKKEFPFKNPSYFTEDHQKNIWVSSSNGFAKYDEISKSFKPFQRSTSIYKISYDVLRKHIWVLKENGIEAVDFVGRLLYELDREITEGFNASNFFQDSNGNIWFGDSRDNDFGIIKLLPNDSIVRYNRIPNDESSLSSNEIRYVTEDAEGTIWIATDDGLNKLKNDKIERIDVDDSYSGNWAMGADNTMWLTTYSGSGLVNIDLNSNSLTNYGQDKGLLHNDVSTRNSQNNDQLAFDAEGRLYLTTQRGLSVFDPKTKVFTNFKEKDGFLLGPSDNRTITLSNGEVLILGIEGINVIDPKVLFEEKNTIPPKVWITNMTVMDSSYSAPDGKIFTKAVDFTEEIELAYWQKDVTLEFVALHYLRPEDNQYSWKLEGYDKDWSAPSLVRTASYTNLSPGTYSFRVKGSNADGIWNEEGASLKITILPPWWQTWWAYIIYALLFLAALRTFSLYRERRLRSEKETLEENVTQRTAELKQSLESLKATQSQLIQSEKMASLGELTAGIAHEIQNPLNFVNNFSEVSVEMMQEVRQEIDTVRAYRDKPIPEDALNEMSIILDDIESNLGKITHHGKRADAIVKGMLAHSRSNSGEKVPTDINALADEYLRLSYHGLRARDKSFNADFKTDFDPDLPIVNVIPQDIGRVLLNLINNAFQASSTEALAKVDPNFKPLVKVSTRKTESGIEISVKDNGPGIPDAIKDKIFQPFFTTKPTGQGTGLGLSLSYDIVKAHGGKLEVSSTVNVGTTFTLSIPIS